MQEHELRVIEEEKELSEKIKKLTSFMGTETFQQIGSFNQKHLREQLNHMFGYKNILKERISRFDDEEFEIEYSYSGYVRESGSLKIRAKNLSDAKEHIRENMSEYFETGIYTRDDRELEFE